MHGIFQARILQWVAISFSRGFPDPGIEPVSPALAGGFTEPPGNPNTRLVGSNSRLPTPVFWPGEFYGLYHGVTKSRTQLSDFHFHFNSND